VPVGLVAKTEGAVIHTNIITAHYTILNYTTLHYTILYYTILYYTILYYTGYIWTDYKTNAQIAKELKITPILDKLLEYKKNWI